MQEISNSIAEAIKFRTTTSILGTYFLFWLVFHWQALYTTFFTNEDLIIGKFDMLKNEYINIYFIQPHFDSSSFYIGILIPALMTYLWTWVLPNLLFIRAFKKEREYKFNKRSKIIEDQIKLKNLEEELALKNANIADLESEAAQKELLTTQSELAKLKSELEAKMAFNEDAVSEEERRYREFMKRPQAKKILEDIKICIYQYGGRLKNLNRAYKLDTDSYVTADTNKLVITSATGEYIELTDLGRYFLSKQ